MVRKYLKRLEWLRRNMPSFDQETERRIREIVIPLIEAGATKENFREKACEMFGRKGWTGWDYILFVFMTVENIKKFIEDTQKILAEERKKFFENPKEWWGE